MGSFITRRLAQMIPTLIGISMVAFILVRLTGDPTAILLPPEASDEVIAQFREEFGLDRPIYVQYLNFMGKVLQGDFGKSIRYRVPVSELFFERLPATLELAFASMAVASLLGIPMGVISAIKHNPWVDNAVRLLSLFGQAIPSFYLGLLLIIIVSVRLRWLPTGGRGDWDQLILPVITLATFLLALIARFTRGAVLDVLRQDFVRTGRAKGLSETALILGHVMKNALIPVVTVIGLQFGAVLSGAVVTETIFAWPGIGRLMVEAISTRDFPIVQATVMIVAVMFVLINLLVDLLYAWLDPRIKYS